MSLFFAVQSGPLPLCTWDTRTEIPVFSERASRNGNTLALEEKDFCAFVLNPADYGREYRICIGDIPIKDLLPNESDADGVSIIGQLVWRDWPYFESARGATSVILESRSRDAAFDPWEKVLQVSVWVNPTKIGEESYEKMAKDLQNVSRSLLVDLYGKSSRSIEVRFANEAKNFPSREEELDSIGVVVERLGAVLHLIQQRPSSRTERQIEPTAYWGTEYVEPKAMAALSRRGIDPRSGVRPVFVIQGRRKESFDIPEHRILAAFLVVLEHRAVVCAKAAANHIRTIDADRPLRDISFNGHASIYEMIDVPKIQRLRNAYRKAITLRLLVRAMENHPFLKGVKPEFVGTRGGVFQRSSEYRELLRLIRCFLVENAVWYDGAAFSVVTKLTSRLFEQWCFLHIVDAFRANGVELEGWTEALHHSLKSKFILDFDRGLQFEGLITSEFKVRFRYEPWILGHKAAETSEETLCRMSHDNVAWSPDIVIECLKMKGEIWEPVYSIVLDCKYTATVRDHHWNDTSKYLQIRSTRSRRQVVRQLWLIHPAFAENIASTDPAVSFDGNGPSCPPDEAVSFKMAVNPGQLKENVAEGAVARFAQGTLNFFRRELI